MTQNPSARSTLTASQTTPTVNGYLAKLESPSLPPRSLHDVCLEIRKKVDNFLAEDPSAPLLRNVQIRLREAIGVVNEAFQRYGYVSRPYSHRRYRFSPL